MGDLRGIVTCAEASALGARLNLLKAAGDFEHNNGTLLAHLVGVWRVLRAARAHPDLASAGLIHSVYSTQFYAAALISTRERAVLQRLFGERAENLAYLFCSLDRSDLWTSRPDGGFSDTTIATLHASGDPCAVQASTANDLFALECANFIDQGYAGEFIGPFQAWAQTLPERGVSLQFRRGPGRRPLTERGEEMAIDFYLSSQEAANASEALAWAAKINHLAAEPLILLAAAAVSQYRFEDGRQLLTAANVRLPLFGASWDKRLTWPEWVEISARLADEIEKGGCVSIDANPADPIALSSWAKARSG